MLDLVRLSDALGNGENAIKYVAYKPASEKSVVLPSAQTGWGTDQEVCVEDDMLWTPVLSIEENGWNVVYLIGSSTKTKIRLSGEKGYENGPAIMDEALKIYSNKNTGAVSKSITRQIFETIPQNYKRTRSAFWIPEQVKGTISYTARGLKVVNAYGHMDSSVLYNLNGGRYSPNYALRPAVRLPENVYVNIQDKKKNGSSPELAMRLYVK